MIEQKVKVTIEAEDGSTVVFAAFLERKEAIVDPFTYHRRDEMGLEYFNGIKLPDPPWFEFRGRSLGDIIITFK